MKYQSEMILNEGEIMKLNHHDDGLSGEAVIDGKNRSPDYANKLLKSQQGRNHATIEKPHTTGMSKLSDDVIFSKMQIPDDLTSRGRSQIITQKRDGEFIIMNPIVTEQDFVFSNQCSKELQDQLEHMMGFKFNDK